MSNFLIYFKQIPRPLWLPLLSGISGILIGTSYIPFPGWALLFCYIPLWIAILEMNSLNFSYRQIFFAGWITQFILTLIGFNWIYYVSSEFGQLPWYLSVSALVLFAALMHIYIPLSLVVACWLFRRRQINSRLIQLLMLALSLSFFERIWPSIFEWNLAYSLFWMRFPLYQFADTVGFLGLSTWILLAQALLAYGLLVRGSHPQKALRYVASVVFVITVLSGVGLYKEKIWSSTDSEVQFAVVQGNIGNSEKILAEQKDRFQSYILSQFSDLTNAHLQKNPQTEIVLWPETAMPFALDTEFLLRPLQNTLLRQVQNWNIALLTGGYSQSTIKKDHLGYPLTRNSVFSIGPRLQLQSEPYHKTALLVFGEYMPFGEEFPILYKLLPFVGVYERGLGPSPQKVILRDQKEITLGPQVCYESLDPAFSRGLADKGAQILFNVTNDSWFGWWAEPYQNNTMSLARAIEVRRPLVRSTNTGITSAVLANGTVLEQSQIGQTWAHTYKISYLKNPPATFYAKVGHWDWILWALIFLLFIIKGNYVRD